ncbi:MAG: alpha/beta fold hydrolase [Chloroflexi bacterium]|nr:alpha/beta fold hydrolase [Chloroflexota bacterium]
MPIASVNNIELYYETHGAGEPLLLIHGLGSSAQDWEFQLEAFSKKYQVVLVDVRGHGRSAKPPGSYSVSLFAQDMAALLTHLQLESAHVVGISMGGMIGLQMVVTYSQFVKSLIVINATPDLIPQSISDYLKVWQRLAISRFMGMRRMGEFLAGRLFPQPDQEYIRVQFIERWAKNDKRAYMAAMKALVGWSVKADLPTITRPVLFLAGDMDYSSVEEKETAVSHIPNGRLQVIPNSRHASPVDQPEMVNTAVLNFLAQQPKADILPRNS